MSDFSASVVDLLTYIEEVEKLKRKPVYVVPSDYFVGHLADMKGSPELQSNLATADGEVWLRIPRLQEQTAPLLPDELALWTVLSKSVDKQPTLKEAIPVFDGKLQVGEESLEKNPHIQELFNWYVKFHWEPWSSVEKIRRKTIAIYNKLFLLYQTLSTDGTENPVELVWGIGMASWKKHESPRISRRPVGLS